MVYNIVAINRITGKRLIIAARTGHFSEKRDKLLAEIRTMRAPDNSFLYILTTEAA
jgi:hypothetical protein